MKDAISTQIDRLKDEDAELHLKNLAETHDKEASDDLMFILGRIKQNEHLSTAISSNLSSQSMLALQQCQREKKHKLLGFDTFDEFLDKSPYSPMSKHQYYDRLGVINKLGGETADLLTTMGISMRTQKLLDKGDLEIKGGTLYYGETEITDSGILKDAVIELVESRKSIKADLEKAKTKLEKQASQIKQGQEDFDELRRHVDSLNVQDPFDRALSSAIYSVLQLTEKIGQLPDKKRKQRADEDTKLFANLWFRIRDAYGSTVALTEANGNDSSDFDKKIEEILADGDLNEGDD